MWCHYCDKNNHNTAECREIAKTKQHKKAQHGTKAVPGKRPYPSFLRKLTPLKSDYNLQRQRIPKRGRLNPYSQLRLI
jgi:hypothetical protein